MDFGTIIIICVICGAIASAIGAQKGRPAWDGFFFGFIFGPLGILLVAILRAPAPKGMRRVTCPRCSAVQNVPDTDTGFQCWQCKQTNPVRAAR